MWSGLLERFRKRKVASGTDFFAFLERNAWLVTQKSVIGYCTVKTQLPVHELLKEDEFARAYDISLWESYAATLADLIVIGQRYLRPHAETGAERLSQRLVEGYESLLAAHPLPTHRVNGWGPEIAEVGQRLAAAPASAAPIREIALVSAGKIVRHLPIHQRLHQPDEPAIVANVQFLMVGLAHEFEKGIDLPAVARQVINGDTAQSADSLL
jgi:hypothetical protein